MSIKLMTFVWDGFPAAGSELLVMLALADWADDNGGTLYPSVKAVGEKARVGEKHARNILHKFEKERYLAVVGNHAGGKAGTTRQYRLNAAKLKLLADEANAKKEAEKAAKYGKKNSVSDPFEDVFDTPPLQVTPNLQLPDASPAGDPYASPAVTMTPPLQVTLTTNEPSIEPPIIQDAKNKPDFFSGICPQVVSDYLTVRKDKGGKTISQTAFNGLQRESLKAGISVEQAMIICCERNWISFKAEWVERRVSREDANLAAGLTIFKPQYIAEQTNYFDESEYAKLN